MSVLEYVRKLLCLLVTGMMLSAAGGETAVEVKFPVLQVKTDVYTNVTVTTVKKDFICIMHSAGVGSIKVADLPDDVKQALGIKLAWKSSDLNVNAQVKKLLANVDLAPVEPLRNAWVETYTSGFQVSGPSRDLALASLAILFISYLLFCYCAKLICQKTGNKPGFLIWLPVLQWLPLVKSASMRPVWVVLLHVPVLNIIGYIAWAVKITRARAKSGFVAFLFMLPGFNVLAFLYLALSAAAPVPNKASFGVRRAPSTLEFESL